jgi:hypothetical protein
MPSHNKKTAVGANTPTQPKNNRCRRLSAVCENKSNSKIATVTKIITAADAAKRPCAGLSVNQSSLTHLPMIDPNSMLVLGSRWRGGAGGAPLVVVDGAGPCIELDDSTAVARVAVDLGLSFSGAASFAVCAKGAQRTVHHPAQQTRTALPPAEVVFYYVTFRLFNRRKPRVKGGKSKSAPFRRRRMRHPKKIGKGGSSRKGAPPARRGRSRRRSTGCRYQG